MSIILKQQQIIDLLFIHITFFFKQFENCKTLKRKNVGRIKLETAPLL